ncbi:MAG: YbaK/EbsC family protein, partial [Clostridia bacterium]
MENKTNVLRILDKKRINYECVEYEMKDEYSAADIADILKIPRSEVFKTLVLVGKSNNFYVFIAPSDKEIDMKKAAKVVGEKAVVMLWSKLLLEITGYVHGGCSPIGMKKP